jgi:hypothetical protein
MYKRSSRIPIRKNYCIILTNTAVCVQAIKVLTVTGLIEIRQGFNKNYFYPHSFVCFLVGSLTELL